MTTYSLASLVDDVTGAARASGDDDTRCAAITPYMRRWLDEGEPLAERYRLPCDGGACGHLLHTDADGAFFIISVVFPAGTSSGVHYHGAWGVIGIVAGIDEETTYARDASPADVAAGQPCELRPSGKVTSPPGTISYLRPPLGGFHRVRAAGDVTGVSLHILGGTPETHQHLRCDGDSRMLVDFPMPALLR